jgi:toxin ParE1/3/4
VRRRLDIRPRAAIDLRDHAAYIALDSEDASERLLDAVERAFQRLLDVPEAGALRERPNRQLAGLRMWPVPEFRNYLIYYRAADSGVEIVRVLHAAQDGPRALRDEGP